MRRLALVLMILAALAFLVALVLSLFNLTLMGKPGTTVWRGVIALVAFAISLLQLQATTSKP
jgi:hypothetical protein